MPYVDPQAVQEPYLSKMTTSLVATLHMSILC